MEIKKELSRILVSEAALRDRIVRLGVQITHDCQQQNWEELTVICVTNGSILFGADLLRQLDLHVRLDCIRVSSYRDENKPVTTPEIIDNIRLDIARRPVLLVDDILDTGATLGKIAQILWDMGPSSLRTCVLLEKPVPRDESLNANYVGFRIPNEFVVGYGLDFAERYRNLPCIGTLRPELQNPPEWC